MCLDCFDIYDVGALSKSRKVERSQIRGVYVESIATFGDVVVFMYARALKSHKGIVAIVVVVFVVVIVVVVVVVFHRGTAVVQQVERDRSRSGLVAVPHTICALGHFGGCRMIKRSTYKPKGR
ncbi:hypothetical protein K449DRAFT_18413 [Hypoxylon sp. EC38]|nr:hypothetical protein K449DRAFT_18413 [Hypoxylon sp. EC38]